MALFAPRPPRYGDLDPGQAESCAALHGAAFAQGWTALEFERLIGARTCLGDAATDGRTGALAGFVLSRAAAGEAEVLTIVVGAPWRGRGIGKALVVRHLGRLAEAGVEVLFLEVNEHNLTARRLYKAAGFVVVGRRDAYYAAEPGREPATALVLRRAID